MVHNQEHEYVCFTCATNKDLEPVIQRELETPQNKAVWIDIRKRRTFKGLGLCFTKNSIFYEYHLRDDVDHQWFNLAQMEDALEKEKEEEKLKSELIIKAD